MQSRSWNQHLVVYLNGQRKNIRLWSRLTEAVGRRPYSVILLDKIDKAAASITGILIEVLNNNAPSNIEGKPVDFSKSIIFMTSSVGTNQLELACTCFDENAYTWKEFNCNPQEFYKNHNCALTGSGCERVVCEARKFFSSDLLDSFDKVIVVEKFRNQKAIARLLLREIVREVAGRRIIVHASNAALVVLLRKASTESEPLGDEAPNYLLTVEEKETIKNQWISLQENITGVAKATSVILDAVLKTIGAPFQLPNLPARHYLFFCLDDDAKWD